MVAGSGHVYYYNRETPGKNMRNPFNKSLLAVLLLLGSAVYAQKVNLTDIA